jgi:hypothetical protein
VSNCILCGKPAGLLHHQHHECVEKHESGKREITNLILDARSSPASVASTGIRVGQVAQQSFISESEMRDLSLAAWSAAVDNALDRGVVSEQVEKRLVELKEDLSLSSGDLLRTDAWDRLAKSTVLRDLMAGVIPQRIQVDGNLPFNFQKGERVVWAFDEVDYLEDKAHRQYVGGSKGVSIRVMKGVYFTSGDLRATPSVGPNGFT